MKERKGHRLRDKFALEATSDDFPTLDDFKTYIDKKIKASLDEFRSCHASCTRLKIKQVPNLVAELVKNNAGLGLPWSRLARCLRLESEKNNLFLIDNIDQRIIFSFWFENDELAICLPSKLIDLT